jgi:hypothetical protein
LFESFDDDDIAIAKREPTQHEFCEHAIGRFRADPEVRAMAVEGRSGQATARDEGE